MLTTRGRRLYKKRGQTVEPVFGQIKSARGCDGCMRRGTAACDSEWKLLCATHNLLKLWRKRERELVPLDAQAATHSGVAGEAERRTGDDPFEDPTPPHGLSKKRLDLAYLEARSGYQTATSWV